MILDFLKNAMIWLVAIIFVVWVFYNLFTNPVGSAHFVMSIVHGIGAAIGAIITFVQSL
jgi:hypothetical protein